MSIKLYLLNLLYYSSITKYAGIFVKLDNDLKNSS